MFWGQCSAMWTCFGERAEISKHTIGRKASMRPSRWRRANDTGAVGDARASTFFKERVQRVMVKWRTNGKFDRNENICVWTSSSTITAFHRSRLVLVSAGWVCVIEHELVQRIIDEERPNKSGETRRGGGKKRVHSPCSPHKNERRNGSLKLCHRKLGRARSFRRILEETEKEKFQCWQHNNFSGSIRLFRRRRRHFPFYRRHTKKKKLNDLVAA